jgi:hypothetical protein
MIIIIEEAHGVRLRIRRRLGEGNETNDASDQGHGRLAIAAGSAGEGGNWWRSRSGGDRRVPDTAAGADRGRRRRGNSVGGGSRGRAPRLPN